MLECTTRCGQLVNGNLRQTGTTSLLYARHTDSHVYRKGILDARTRPRRFFSYPRRYEAFRSFTKYRTTGVIYEIAYPITLNILRARLYYTTVSLTRRLDECITSPGYYLSTPQFLIDARDSRIMKLFFCFSSISSFAER